MAPRLSSESKRALLEQALRLQTESNEHSDLFVKLLRVNHSFVNVGRNFQITQLCLTMDPPSTVDFFFGSSFFTRTSFFNFTVKEARNLIKLFQIKLLKFKTTYLCGDKFDDYWRLIDYVNDKIDLEFDKTGTFEDSKQLAGDVVTGFWNKITSLKAPAKVLCSHWCQPSKHFDQLIVTSVQCIRDLKRILRHDVDQLELEFDGHLATSEVSELLKTAKKIKIKKCTLTYHTVSGEIGVIIPLVRCINGISPTCEDINVKICILGRGTITETTDQLILEISQRYDIFIKAKTLLRTLSLNLRLIVISVRLTNFNYRLENDKMGWFNILKLNNPDLSNAIYRVNGAEHVFLDEIVLKTVDDMVKSKFHVIICHSVREVN